jgi:hypothetical protein
VKKLVGYHGTNNRFSQFEQSKARLANDFYGGGVAYFTDDINVAKTYAAAAFRRDGGDRFVYEVDLYFNKLFDVDDRFTGDELVKLVGKNVEAFARAAGLLKLSDNRLRILRRLKDGEYTLTGEQVFRGLSNGMVNTARARDTLIANGYDGLRYNGGANMQTHLHNVYLAYNARAISIRQRYIVSKTPVEPQERREVYTFIN